MDKIKVNTEDIYLAPEAEASGDIVFNEPVDGMENQYVPVTVEAEPKKNVRVGEILDLRESNRKVYRMSDGTEQAVFYSETVHVFNDDTKTFDDVDNTLVEEEDGRHFVSSKNHFIAKFSKEEANDELFSITSGVHRVTVSARKNRKHKNKGVQPRLHKKATEGFERTDTLVFEGVQNGADYAYFVTGNGVKENIIVKKRADVYRYPFVLHMENVTAEFDENNKRIAFLSKENGTEVFFIPAPFMTDANGIVSTAVTYELRTTANGDAIFTVTPDSEWMNVKHRAFPVVIDPQIQLNTGSDMTTYSWDNGYLYSSLLHTIGTVGCGAASYEASMLCDTGAGTAVCYSPNRMYMSFNMPTLPRNPRIKKAELKFFQASGVCECGEYPKLGLYQVNDGLGTGFCTPYNDTDLIDFAKMKIGHCEDGTVVSYTFDVTSLVDKINKGESYSPRLVLKMIDESCEANNYVSLYGSAYSGNYAPEFIVTYESTYGVHSSYRTHTHELGRFGQGSIDLQCGNLMFESEDFAWAGNRMPVTIKHLYNSALYTYQYTANSSIKLSTANFSAMKLGYGYKLNIMQSMMFTTFQHEGEQYAGYVYIDENGEEIFFKKSDKQVCSNSNSHCYNLYEDVNSGDMLYDPVMLTLKQGEDTYQFDYMGRLVQIKDAAGNHMDIIYTSNRITSVTDGAGRDFSFAYNSNGFLTSITAPDETSILYTYSGNLLSTIAYPDDRKVVFTYSSSKPTAVTLLDISGNNVYKVVYSYNGNRLYSVTEYGVEDGNFVQGAKSTYSYSVASGRTVVQTTEQMDTEEGECYDNVIKTVYTFDDEGNIVSEYVYSQDTGNVGVEGEESGIHPHSSNGGAGVVSNINNLLINHSFKDLSHWYSLPYNCSNFMVSNYNNDSDSLFGGKTCWIRNHGKNDDLNGIYQVSNTLPAGEYTFSVYAKIDSAFCGSQDSGVFIRVTDAWDNILAESERLATENYKYIRLIAPFEISSAQSVKVQIMIKGRGSVDVDGAQLENNPYANAYNMLENGNFERSSGWSRTSGVFYTSGTRFNMSRSLMITGNLESGCCAYQNVMVKKMRSTRETFTLSGWAKGYGLPNYARDGVTTPPTFRLRADIKYQNVAEPESYTANFSPCTEDWQFASVEFAKQVYREVEYITVCCDYGYNTGVAYFDDIQLVRNNIETSLSSADFETSKGGSEGAKNDEFATKADTAPVFSEAKDAYGNVITETTFANGEFGTIYRAFGFTPDCNCAENAGNDLVSETDARGNKVFYAVDEDTSRNEEVTDRCGNKTAYAYDASGKTTKITSKDAYDAELANVSYTYDAFDNMTEIVRGDGMKYALSYNAFHNLESIGVDGKTDKLVRYTYKPGNGRLKAIQYANGDTMRASYNSVGQMVAEKWFDKNNTLVAHYKYVYDGQGNIVRSIDILSKKEYNYVYEGEKLLHSAEYDIVLSDEIVISKSLVNTVDYYYADDEIARKVITFANGTTQTVYYDHKEDSTVVMFRAGGETITAHSKNDAFGRKVFDELQLGTGFVSREFHYHPGEVTDEHRNNAKLKSSATTQLVSQIVLSKDRTGSYEYNKKGRTISYEYDEEDRVTAVDDSVDGITTYTYDALGQLLTETVNGKVVTTMTYDNYGNIRTKNGMEYTYGDGNWKDLLTAYNGQSIAYDAQGNPTNYLGHTLTWEKGRQLKRFVKEDGTVIDYTYNANGIRTSKTIGGIKHTYTLDGTKILREEWDGNVLIPLYNNEESVCGIIYNDEPFYFQKNLQGDVIAIVDKDAEKVVASYTYDAWGVYTIQSDSSNCQIATINPYRYRSYYYDEETEIYYLQSRYYNPMLGRFVNEDSQFDSEADLLGYNIFAYCGNNPVSNVDYMGTGLLLAIGIGLLLGAIVGGTASYIKYKKVKISWIAGGAVIGALVAAGGYWVYTTVKGAAATWSAYKAAQIGAGASTGSAAIGRMFERFYYSFNNITTKFQQVVWKNLRFDAIFKNRIIELKNYNWSKYSPSQIQNIAGQFVRQGQRYQQAIGQYVGGQKIRGITFFFSSKPPQAIIKALKALAIAVDWVK